MSIIHKSATLIPYDQRNARNQTMGLITESKSNHSERLSDGENANEEETWTSTFTEYDVLAIRGVGQNKNPGNLLFRDLVSERKLQYETSISVEYRRKLGEEIVELIKPGRFLKKEDASQRMFKIMDHQSAVTKAMFAIRDLKVGTGGIPRRRNSKSETQNPKLSKELKHNESSNASKRQKNKDTSKQKTSTERRSKMTESIEMVEPKSTLPAPNKVSNRRLKTSIPKTSKIDNNESSDLSESDLESKASSRASIGNRNRRRKPTSGSTNSNSPQKVIKHVRRKYYYEDTSDNDAPDVPVIDLVHKIQSPSKRPKLLAPSSHTQQPKIAIPFRGYGFPFTVLVRSLTPLQESTTEVLSDIDMAASKDLVMLKHFKSEPL